MLLLPASQPDETPQYYLCVLKSTKFPTTTKEDELVPYKQIRSDRVQSEPQRVLARAEEDAESLTQRRTPAKVNGVEIK